MGTKQEELDGITREKLMSKLKKAIAKNKERVAEMEKEGRDYIDSQTNKDAIATSEAYLSAYHETRDKYRRAG
jgi:rubrerythrin